ncbi:MAG TPA: GNAT family N-acetyltransferase [Planctomycetota bacterium]
MPVQLETVRGRRGRRRFVALARKFRGASPHFVAPLTGEIAKQLDPARNPALRTMAQRLWIARDRGGNARGRIAASFEPAHAECLGEAAGWFGFFDADEPKVAALLLARAVEWLRDQGAVAMLGPADPDTNHECGCLIEGHDEMPYMMMPHHPRHYADWFEAAGMCKAKDLLAYEAHASRFPMDRLRAVVDRALSRGRFEIVPITRRQLPWLLDVAVEVYNSAWRENWGFLPMSREEFAFEARSMKPLLDPGLAKVATHDGRPAGFVLGLPDVNQALHAIDSKLFPFGILRLPRLLKKIDRMRVLALGVVPEFRNKGLEAALVYQISKYSIDHGMPTSEMSWLLEDNKAMISLAETLGGRLSRRFRIYRLPLVPAAGSPS